MLFASQAERGFARAISELVYCNPFAEQRIAREREALGEEFVSGERVWSQLSDSMSSRPNIGRLAEKVETFAPVLRQRLADGASASAADLMLYEDVIFYLLYHRFNESFQAMLDAPPTGKPPKVPFYPAYRKEAEHYLHIPGMKLPGQESVQHLFALFYQVRRAFFHIFGHLVGRSMPVARLRAAAWESICTHDMRRYRRVLFDKMGDLTTLITGESGTGKELVARAIGLSRYVPFDEKSMSFAEDVTGSFYALNLSALSPTLIESELFGHRRGAFTGALEDRAGWLEVCRPLGTVFLDEIGELDGQIQVKLLRVLHTRTFQRLGDTHSRYFHGKIIAATNRNLAEEMSGGRFRKDFYYRLCADMITTPPLREQLADAPDDLPNLILFITRRLVGEEAEALAEEVQRWIEQKLGMDYPWPGNFRELEQCVKNILVRREYRPPVAPVATRSQAEQMIEAMGQGRMSAEELLRKYCAMVYAQTGSYEETARRLGLDRRTVKAKVTGENPKTETRNSNQ